MENDYKNFKAGIYKHYKGPLYLVLGLGHDANDESRTVVIYIGLQLDKAKSGPRLAIRDYNDFYAFVDPSNGKQLDKNNPKSVPRFEFSGHSLDQKQV